jgi:hypothetical protein
MTIHVPDEYVVLYFPLLLTSIILDGSPLQKQPSLTAQGEKIILA